MHRRSLAFAAVVVAACAPDDGHATPDDDVDASDFAWVAPGEGVARGEVVELVVNARDPNARAVTFEVDCAPLATCDAGEIDQDCHRGSTFRWSAVFETAGTHRLRATLGDRVADKRIDVQEQPLEAAENPLEETFDDPIESDPFDLEQATIPLGSLRGSLDPARKFHRVFGGIAWAVQDQRVRLKNGVPRSAVAAIARCMKRYGPTIRKYADARKISRASVVATAITESGCSNPKGSSDGLSSGPMQVTGSTCSAITGLSSTTCRIRMHTRPWFSFDVGTRYMASSYQRGQHHRDPPKIAAAYNAGSIRKSFKNRWRMVSTGNHIDRFVSAYNAYRVWEARRLENVSLDDAIAIPEATFSGKHVRTIAELPIDGAASEVVFVGDWSSRDGEFYERESGRWVSAVDPD
jgi:hypothetical protein